MIGKYTFKVLRDGGLSATMIALVLTNSIEKPWLKGLAIACAAGATMCAVARGELMMNELQGFRTFGRRLVA